MGWKYSEKVKTILATPTLVKEFCEMEPAPHDRPLSERRLLVYERILLAGEFRTVTWASCICKETGTTYRVNGKHTSMLLLGRKPFPEFYVTLERYTADRLTDVANLYNTFDSGLASRSVSDVNAAFAATVPALKEIPLRVIGLCVNAIAFHKWSETEIRRISPAEKAEELLDNQDFVEWVAPILKGGAGAGINNVRWIGRAPVVQAMLATYRRHKAESDEFWWAVRQESAPKTEDPSRALARYLVRVVTGGRGVPNRRIVTNREVYVKCLHAWNAWRNDETTNLNYYAKADIPKVT